MQVTYSQLDTMGPDKSSSGNGTSGPALASTERAPGGAAPSGSKVSCQRSRLEQEKVKVSCTEVVFIYLFVCLFEQPLFLHLPFSFLPLFFVSCLLFPPFSLSSSSLNLSLSLCLSPSLSLSLYIAVFVTLILIHHVGNVHFRFKRQRRLSRVCVCGISLYICGWGTWG